MIKKLHVRLQQLLDLPYVLRFVVKFAALYFLFNFFHQVWLGITAPGGGIYSPFLERYLNYIGFLRESILKTGVFIAGIFSAPSSLVSQTTVDVSGGGSLFMGLPCIGLELFSFWAAFVIADTSAFLKKIIWCLAGWVSIWAINGLRIGLLIIATKERWQLLYLDQHTLFTTAAYALIFLLIFIYYQKNKQQPGL